MNKEYHDLLERFCTINRKREHPLRDRDQKCTYLYHQCAECYRTSLFQRPIGHRILCASLACSFNTFVDRQCPLSHCSQAHHGTACFAVDLLLFKKPSCHMKYTGHSSQEDCRQKKRERNDNSIERGDSRQDVAIRLAKEGVSWTTANRHSEDCHRVRKGMGLHNTRIGWRRPVLSPSAPVGCTPSMLPVHDTHIELQRPSGPSRNWWFTHARRGKSKSGDKNADESGGDGATLLGVART
ncbi:hypothetical protein EDB84DRAFT_675775 [Lactarius hengduanensis]|nr:hypothetical protein EDB84DRAFT_675775 [Lactarius hengduanensis]